MQLMTKWKLSAMWYLIEDFFDQSWVMKAAIGWGWLCVLIMVSSMASSVLALLSPSA